MRKLCWQSWIEPFCSVPFLGLMHLHRAFRAGKTLGPSSFVLGAFGRIQIHRQIWKFIEQYKLASLGVLLRSKCTSRLEPLLYSTILWRLEKKGEGEIKKGGGKRRQQEINTLITETASSPSLPLSSQSLIVSFLAVFPPFSSVIWSKLRHDNAGEGCGTKEYISAEVKLKLLAVSCHGYELSSLSERSLTNQRVKLVNTPKVQHLSLLLQNLSFFVKCSLTFQIGGWNHHRLRILVMLLWVGWLSSFPG